METINWKYMSKNPLVKFTVEKFLSRMKEIMSNSSPNNLLDVGVGDGWILREITKDANIADCTGFDLDENKLSLARKLNPNFKIVKGDVYSLPFKDGSFDMVMCSEVLEHLNDPDNATKELKRVAKKELVLTVPYDFFFRLGNLTRGKFLKKLGNYPGHVQHYSPGNFKRFLQGHFNKVELFVPLPFTFIIAHCLK